MIRSFLTLTLRILWRNKVTSFVNIFSLSVGIAVFVAIMLYLHHEYGYDKFNKNYPHIYRVEGDNYAKLPPVIGTYLKDNLPEVKDIARLALGRNEYVTYIPENDPENKKEIKVNNFWADSTVFDVFTFSFLQGDPNTALKDPYTIVLSESSAKKLFDDDYPLLKSIEIRGHQFRVTGIIKNVKNSHVEIDALVSQESIPKVFPERDINNTTRNSWLWSATYLLMSDKIDESAVENKINNVLSEINDGELFDMQFKHFHIRPLKDIYFNGSLQYLNYGLHGNLKLNRVLFAIGIFMLALGCINYVNLTTARSTIRAKEVAVKMVSGSSKNLLRSQLIVESIIITLISVSVAITILSIFISKFNQFAWVDIPVNELNRPVVWGIMVGGGLVIGFLAGVYPAFYLTSVKPIELIKGKGVKGKSKSVFRWTLMTFQFAAAMIMIIGIFVNLRQLQFVKTKDLGFNKEHIITIRTPSQPGDEQYRLRKNFKNRLLQYPGILNMTFSGGEPGSEIPTATYEIDGIKRTMPGILIEEDYLKVMGIQLVEGSAFPLAETDGEEPGPIVEDNNTNPGKGIKRRTILLNEVAARDFEIDSPIGKIIYWKDGARSRALEITGIVNDFHFQSLHDKIKPLIMWCWGPPMSIASIKISSDNIPGTLENIKTEWENVYGLAHFNYQFLDDSFDRQYKSDDQMAVVVGYFTVLAVVIACLGLFALSSFMVSRRTKEIGIRKAMGASVTRIYMMLAWDFLKLVLLAAIIASVVGWHLMNTWLNGFAYHIDLGLDIFILAILITIIIALSTITWQSLTTARSNPMETLRYE